MKGLVLEADELSPNGKLVMALQPPAKPLMIFEPVVHGATLIKVEGAPAIERQELTVTFTSGGSSPLEAPLRPGALRLTLQNRTDRRLLPAVIVLGDEFHGLLARRRPYLTAKRLLNQQSFQDLYGAETLDVNQRLKVTSLTILFTDLKGSTAMYERIGDLSAYDLVKSHFKVLTDVVNERGGAVVKTIGDAIMATFPTSAQGVEAALEMRDRMVAFNKESRREDLIVKIGVHEGPCLAVVSNDRLDYFGQTVNVASRVQGLASSQSIYTTRPVIDNPTVSSLLGSRGIRPLEKTASLRGISQEWTVYEIG